MGMMEKAKEQIKQVKEFMQTQESCPQCNSQYLHLIEGTVAYAIYTCISCQNEFKVVYK